MSILGGLRIILGIVLVIAGIFCLCTKIGGFGGFLCGIVLVIMGNVKGFNTVASFLGLKNSNFEILLTFCLIGAGVLALMDMEFISNVLGGVGTIILGIFTTGLLAGQQLQPVFNILSHGFMVLAFPLFLVALAIVLFSRW